ncbi:zinc transporter ZIP11 [Anopheles stephensi]|uniref:Zinc transporter ZIP11 n=1 Tax=Anopheles stephensi TaxID=30069 RepID=A0A182XZB3_ANOST|nr:zinc transporter ZIP11 [Anopheles stephensi]XP_035915542.1 zinc transporter ZIP11 [Anopheles stephensi]XP_035915543.1 zinc transporter ZIP11 [Anopheles stephensi]XP_035915544.1 zinc transporter ZIP11 [Anopheles stephensi]XP_035915545.1 zinc transporter ZIP11 [Anopheles stephensi]XP_035915546.1 zinc transporter ZIP11 [Anopheles stephensi]XP_035915548.1 zinc transporter ZIP11 [Anopheles stephensi]XP_035915549.1 zinc transporter ZIP11 [Anopheles stephensi]XP_035915550.1 zinc transporter ZIP
MIQGYGSVTQALLGTLLTWGLTALGSGLVVLLRGNQRKSLDISLGFAAGVMIAASFWSLLAPAIELAESSHMYGSKGEFAFIPVAVGFLLGAIFVYGTDKVISYLGINSPTMMIALTHANKDKADIAMDDQVSAEHGRSSYAGVAPTSTDHALAIGMDSFADCLNAQHGSTVSRKRRKGSSTASAKEQSVYTNNSQSQLDAQLSQWKRIMLLVVAITVHNIPEGLAVGVSFGAIGTTESATFEAARNLAIGIGIQNFPEGLAVSLPLHAAGFSLGKSFWYGQLSGMVEPIFGVLGAVAVSLATIILPYALSFAAGAMIYIVADDILPEAHASDNGQIATWGTIAGFVVMMCLDVGLG